MVAGGFRRQLEAAAIDGDKFIGLIVEAVPGQADIRVWNDDAFECGVVELAGVRAFDERLVVSPIPVDRKDHAAPGIGITGRRVARKRAGCKRRARNHGAGRFQEVASVHGCPFDRIKNMNGG